MKISLKRTAKALVATLAIALAAPAASAQTKTLQMASTGVSSPTTVFSIAVSEILKRELDYRTQLATGAAATRQAVDAANGRLDLYVTAVSINEYMKNNGAMFKDMAEAPELFKKLRGIMNYPFGAYHPVVWADSGIETMEDIKGKKVFTGPPSGAARGVSEAIVKGSTGMVANEDYETVNLDWSSASQAFQDRQIDVYFLPTPIPSPALAQISALGEFRVLTISDEAAETEVMKAQSELPGRSYAMLPADTYENLVNTEAVRVINSTVGLGTRADMADDDIYAITKAIFEYKADLVAAAKWMEQITPESALAQMNMPLHPGAYRYYQEIGVDVPEEIRPPAAD